MPIVPPFPIRSLSPDEFAAIDYRMMGHAFASQNELGRLCEEQVFQADLQARLLADGFQEVAIEEPLTVTFRDFSKTYRLDLVADHAVYEFKTAASLTGEHKAQLLNYLFLLGISRGKLINFRAPKVQGQIVATGLTTDVRRQVTVDASEWNDRTRQCVLLRETMVALLKDWGAFLDFSIYQEALTHFLGGEEQVICRIPLKRADISLGTQRIYLHADGHAFRVTALTREHAAFRQHLWKLLAHTDLHCLQWINLNRSRIEFVTLEK